MYVELYIIRALNAGYKKSLDLAMFTINLRDTCALKKLDKGIIKAEKMREAASRMLTVAGEQEVESNTKYAESARKVNAAYNALQNARDDAKLEV